jgi:hypothetical protein
MAAWNPFTSNAFELISLTAAINRLPFQPMRLGELGLFDEAGVTTLDVAIESRNGVIQLIPAKPRNAPGTPITADLRDVRPIRIPHILATGAVVAEEVQNIRAFGSDTLMQTVQTKINDELAKGRRCIDYTIETHRVAAIMGNYYNANGTTTSLFTEFGVAQQTIGMVLLTAATNLFQKAIAIKQAIKTGMGGIPYRGVRVLCGDTFWGSFYGHAVRTATYLNSPDNGAIRGDPTTSVNWGGITWEWYSGTTDCQIPLTEAYAIPEGVPGMFITRYAPAPYQETVNTIGLPYYSKSEQMKFGKGVELEMQSNALNICTIPRAVIKLTET